MSTVGQFLARFVSRGKAAVRAGRLRARLAATLLPPTCCLCGAPGIDPALDLCGICLEQLPRRMGPDGGPSEDLAGFELTVVPYRYDYPVDRLVRALKFRGERQYARVLGTLLAEARCRIDTPLPGCLVPVPLHAARHRERGFNQSHELARFAAARLALPVEARCLARITSTCEQSGLSLPERRRNVRGAFRALHRPATRRVALLDDVLTTGSTVREAARALRVAGVEQIELWAVARAVLRK